jgi:hypothetical protein
MKQLSFENYIIKAIMKTVLCNRLGRLFRLLYKYEEGKTD